MNCISRTFTVLLLSFIAIPLQSFAQSNTGEEFLVTFLDNFVGPTVEVHLSAEEATTVAVNYPANNPTFTQNANVTPGNVTVVTIPGAAESDWIANTVQDNAVSLSADSEFTAYLINRAGASSDAALAFPTDAFNRDYIITTNNSLFFGIFTVIASSDNTEVSITPSKALTGGRAADTEFTVTLDAGEVYYGTEAADSVGGLTGTIISATKPVGVYMGNQCANHPNGACDHNVDSAIPVQAWGSEFFAANYPNRQDGALYRVVASQDNTQVAKDGVVQGTIDRAEFLDIGQDPDDFVLSADKPISVLQIQPGKVIADPGQLGDPAFSNLVASDQFKTDYTFSTLDAAQFPDNFVIIVASNDDVGTLELDGVAVAAGDFSQIGASSFSVARIAVGDGVHTTSSTNPHSVVVVGYGGSNSYQYLGAARLRAINNEGDILPPECSSVVADDNNSAEVTGTDNRPEQMVGGETTEDTGIFTASLVDGSTNVELTVPDFDLGDGSVTSTLSLVDTDSTGEGTVRYTDGAGNSCESEVSLGVEPTPTPAPTPEVTDPECEETEVSTDLFSMDGGADVQAFTIRRLAGLFRQAGGTRKQRNQISRRANNFRTEAWTNTWSIPTTVAQSCEDTSSCEEVDLTSPTESYTSAVESLRQLMQRTAKRVLRKDPSRRIQRLVKRFRKAGRAAYNTNIETVQSIPDTHQDCD